MLFPQFAPILRMLYFSTMPNDGVTQVEIKHLKEGQGEIKATMKRVEEKMDSMDKHFAVEIAKLKQAYRTRSTITASIISGAALLITIIVNFFR